MKFSKLGMDVLGKKSVKVGWWVGDKSGWGGTLRT